MVSISRRQLARILLRETVFPRMQSRIYESNGVVEYALIPWLHRYVGVGAKNIEGTV